MGHAAGRLSNINRAVVRGIVPAQHTTMTRADFDSVAATSLEDVRGGVGALRAGSNAFYNNVGARQYNHLRNQFSPWRRPVFDLGYTWSASPG